MGFIILRGFLKMDKKAQTVDETIKWIIYFAILIAVTFAIKGLVGKFI